MGEVALDEPPRKRRPPCGGLHVCDDPEASFRGRPGGVDLLPLAGIAFADLATARAATAGFHRVGAAEAAGYGEFRDAAGVACVAQPALEAMGIHYVNGALSEMLDPARPEALVYEPGLFGYLRLVALEYIVFKASGRRLEHVAAVALRHDV